MNLPAQPENLVTVAARLGASARRAFGIEVVTSGQPAAPASGERSIYDLTGLSLPDALNKIMEFIPGYASSAQSDVVHVRPKGADGPVPTVLDRRVPKFAGRFENLQLAMRAVSALISGAADPSVVPAFGNFPPAAWSDEVKALVTRPVEIDLTDVTIRQILDEVARKHGAMSWAVIHRGSIDGPQGLQLVFLGFEQWSVNTTTRIGR
jgi:hypothetical protein